MGLQKAIIPLEFKGINTAVDPKVLGADLMRLENGRRDRLGAITKRCGTTNYASSYTEPFLAACDNLALLIGEGSLRVDNGTAFDSATTAVGFADIDLACVASKKRTNYLYPDICVLGSVAVYVFTDYRDDATTGSAYTVTIETRNKTTGLLISSVQPFGSGAEKQYGKVVLNTGTTALVFAIKQSTNAMNYCTVDAAGAIGAAAAMDGGLPATKTTTCSFDVIQCLDANRTVLLSYIDTNDDVTTLLWRTGPTTVGSTTFTGSYSRVGVWRHAAGKYAVAYYSSARTCYVRMFDDALGNAGTEISFDSLSANWTLHSITGCANAAGTASYCYYTAVNTTSNANPQIKRDTFTLSGTTISSAGGVEQVRRCLLASRPWSTTTDTYVIVRYRAKPNSGGTSDIATAAQSGYYLLSTLVSAAGPVASLSPTAAPGGVVGKALIGRAGTNEAATAGWGVTGSVCSVNVITANSVYRTCLLGWTAGQINPGDTVLNRASSFDDVAVYKAEITVGSPASLGTVERAGLCVPNSNPYGWDGKTLIEQGFHQYPEGLAIAAGSATGTLAATSLFGYVACYERTDSRGQTHRSSPSPVSSFTTTSTRKIAVTVPTLTLTRETGVSIVLYRTDANGSVFYRIASTPNNNGDSVTFTDDGALVTVTGTSVTSTSYTGTGTSLLSTSGAPWVYTTGNVVENIQPSPHRVACIHAGRYVYADREWESTTVRYSRYLVDGEGPGWNDVMTIVVPQDGGAITALASFQDRLIIFKSDRIFVAGGVGLSDAGTGQDFAPPSLLHAGHGCNAQKSVLQIPDGLAFGSARGLCLLGADFQVNDKFGAPVKYHTDSLTLSAACLIADKGYAIWTTTAGLGLVYSWQWQQWSTFTNHEASDAAVVGGLLYRHYSSTVRKEARASFLDGSASGSYSMRLVTGWLPIAQQSAIGRLYELRLIGQNIGDHQLNVATGYDLDPYWDPDVTANAPQTFNAKTFGGHFDQSAYHGAGSSTLADKAYEISARFSRGKMRYVRWMIWDLDADISTITDEGWSVTKLELLVGLKPQGFRSDTTRRMA